MNEHESEPQNDAMTEEQYELIRRRKERYFYELEMVACGNEFFLDVVSRRSGVPKEQVLAIVNGWRNDA